MGGIFLSYRRDDSAGHAGRLYDRLSVHFGPDQIFRDLDSISFGTEFTQTIREAVATCDSLVAVIGREWSTITRTGGGRRLDDPRDFVRLEIAAALERGIPVIPVLVEDAVMPEEDDLPVPLVRLSKYNGLALSDSRWNYDVERLLSALERWTPPASQPPGSPAPIDVAPAPEAVPGPEPAPAPARPPRPPRPPRPERPAPDRGWLKIAIPAACIAVVVVALALALGGGGGGDGTPAPTPTTTPGTDVSGPTEIDVTVPATVDWTRTPLQLKPGDVVTVEATGQMRDDVANRPGRFFDPAGRPEPGDHPGDPLQDANHAALIGKVGDGPEFALGKDGTHPVVSAGTLYLGMNDGIFDDNAGNYQVHVTVRRP